MALVRKHHLKGAALILTHTYTFTVPPSAIDVNGHVNNVAFVQWMQDAAVAHSDAVGCTAATNVHHALWVARSHHIEYKRQAFVGDLIEVRTWIADCRHVSSRRNYEFHRVPQNSEPAPTLLAKGQTDWVLIDATTHHPKPIPQEIQDLFTPPTPYLPLLQSFTHIFPAEAHRATDALHFLAATKGSPTERNNFDGHFTASAFILSPDHTQALLIFHKRLQRWLQPGGHINPHELPLDAAIREAHEETGLAKSALRLHPFHSAHTPLLPIDIDSHPIPANPSKNEPAHIHHDLLYLFHTDPTMPLSPELNEVTTATWLPIADLATRHPRLHHLTQKLLTSNF